MGLVINISYYWDWKCTYFVQNMDEIEAKEKAFKMFKQTMSCYLPDTLKEAEKNESFSIEIVAEVEHIIF